MSCPLNDILVYAVQLYYLVTFKFCFHFSLDISTTPSLLQFYTLVSSKSSKCQNNWYISLIHKYTGYDKKYSVVHTYFFVSPEMITSGYLFVKPSGSSTHIPTMMRFLSNKLILEAICFVLVLTFSFPYTMVLIICSY